MRLDIIKTIQDNPGITAKEIAELVGIHYVNVINQLKTIERNDNMTIHDRGDYIHFEFYAIKKIKGSHTPYKYYIEK